MTKQDKMIIATLAMQGMLAHPTRYKPREQDAHMHWHDALATEAFEIADAMARVEIAREAQGHD